MKKKYIIYIAILIFVIIFVSIFMFDRYNGKSIIKNINQESRSKEEIMQLVSDEYIDSLVVNEYSNNDLKKIESTNLDLENLDAKYVIECIREDNSMPNSFYRVVYRSNNKYLFVYFDENGEKLFSFISEMSKEKNKFDSVKIGKDSKINVFFKSFNLSTLSNLSFSLKHNVKKSGHCTKDGYLITFEYDDNDIVIDKTVELI